MTDYLIDGEILGDIADAIREKTNSPDTITPENMASEISNIPSGVDPDNLATVDKVKQIHATNPTNINHNEYDGIAYDLYYDMTNKVASEIYSSGAMSIRIPVRAGENVEFTQDTDGYIKINATSGGSFEMPQIRFANATYTNGTKMVDADNPLTLSVEIVGGGTLQEGDKLQICVRRTYGYKRNDMPYRKQKLRAVWTYGITNEDIDKRFISISTGDLVNSWLFRNDRNSTINGEIDTQSAFYLRIKRVTKYNGDGVDCDAIF